MYKIIQSRFIRFFLATVTLLTIFVMLPIYTAMALPYGTGKYGTCTYNTCGITLTSSNNISVGVTPSDGTGDCSINNDSVSVLTGSSTGYTLTLSTNSTSTSLSNGTSNITAGTGTYSSPTALGINQWGYRVDGVGGFGPGPTSSISNTAYPISAVFAGAVANNVPATTIVTSSVAANPAVTTNVWYGVCVNSSLSTGLYTGQILYSATTN